MANIESIQLGLTSELLGRIRYEAEWRKTTVQALIRTIVEQHLDTSDRLYAHELLMAHFAEDRNEIRKLDEKRS